MTNIICGVDIGATHLDARIGQDGPWQRFATTDEGLAALVDFCQGHGVTLAAMEATGGYERKPFARLWAAGVPAAVVNPRAVRRFAEAMGALEKTDRIDCGLIALYAATKRITPTPPAKATQQALTALVGRLRQLTQARVDQANQMRLVTDPAVRDTFAPVLNVLAAQIRALETKIAALIDADPLWQKLDTAFRTIKGGMSQGPRLATRDGVANGGVADRTVARLIAELPEIGTLSNKAIAKLAGLAPIANDSGKRAGRRAIRGGRAGVRAILFVVAEVVRRHEPDFKAFHHTLTSAGKPKKVVRIALAHKLLTRLNAKTRDVRANVQAPA